MSKSWIPITQRKKKEVARKAVEKAFGKVNTKHLKEAHAIILQLLDENPNRYLEFHEKFVRTIEEPLIDDTADRLNPQPLLFEAGFSYPHLSELSTAYDPCIYEFFFSLQARQRHDDDLVLSHTRYTPDNPMEESELKEAALAWKGLPPPPPNSKAKWKFRRVPKRGHCKEFLEHSITLPDSTVLFLIIQGR